ncbi:intraflagellar transport protein 140 [Novymonas esmeraldas]|uniref:Intraflagellar transport protein 140 n=1 Tax=Novymonas esmeraldas TaxID=1808958 RepID=A0AAW0F0J1_9TRYP
MSLFVVNTPEHEGQLKENVMAAHRCKPLLATAWVNPPSVLITSNEGEVLTPVQEPASPTGRTQLPTSLAWHPTEPLLVIGWSNGKMTLWAMPSASSLALGEEVTAAATSSAVQAIAARAASLTDAEGAVREHGAGAVLAVEWSTHGTYLASASQQRHVVVWSLEHTATETSVHFKLKPLWSVQAREPVVRIMHVPGDAPLAVSGAKGRASTTTTAATAAGGGDDDISFLLADGGMTVSAVNEEQQLFPCVTQQEAIVSVLYDAGRQTLVTLSSSYMIEVYRVGEDLKGTSTLRRKLSTSSTAAAASVATGERIAMSMVWASPGVVAFGGGDDRLRVFDLASESMDVLSLPQPGLHVSCMATFATKGIMAAGTVEGVLVVFQHSDSSAAAGRHGAVAKDGGAGIAPRLEIGAVAGVASQWEALAVHQVSKYVDRVIFTALGDVVLCRGGSELQVLHETIRKRAWDGVAAATQISADMVVIESVTGCQCLLHSKGNVRGLSIAFPNIALWNGSQIDLYTINEATSEFTLVNFVPTSSPAFAIHRDGLIYVKGNRVVFETLQLSPIAQMTFTEAEGVPVIMDIMNDYLVAVSSRNYLRLARVSSRDLRQVGPARPLTFPSAPPPPPTAAAATADDGSGGAAAREARALEVTVTAARVNAQGRRVALMTSLGPLGFPDTRVWVYDSDTDKMSSFDFGGRNEMPNSVYWNTPEPNTSTVGEFEYLLLACETHQVHMEDKKAAPEEVVSPRVGVDPAVSGGNNSSIDGGAGQESLPEALPDMENFAEKKIELEDARRGSVDATSYVSRRAHNIVTLFATHGGLVVQNVASMRRYQICLVGLTIPDFLLASVKINGNPSNADDYVIEQKRLRDFEGLKSDKDVAVREALMKFSYYSTIGNMDEAYRCVKNIKNPAAWQGLARLCVASGRLDVAAVCLATMEDCVAARALREAREEYPNDKGVQLASLALGLGMTEEAEELLRKSRRYDLMTDVYMSCGKFEHAQRHSERFDRARIRPVAYKYAQFMESLQNMDAAIMWYYNAKCAGTDVPRIFFQTNRMNELRQLMVPPSHPPSPSAGAGAGAPAEQAGAAAAVTPVAAAAAAAAAQSPFSTIFPHNRELLLWWAQHSERRRNVQEALRFYHAGEDVYNVVRLLCSLTPPKLANAVQLVKKETDKAKARFEQQQAFAAAAPGRRGGSDDQGEPDPVGAAYFVAQLYERQSDPQHALQYYQAAGAYRSGVRVAWKMEQYGVAVSLAMKSADERLMLETAMQLERQQQYDKAVQLYRRIGAVQCALDACVRGGLYDTLHEVSASLASGSTDPAVFLGMADHFQSEGDYQKAVEMLVFAKHFDEALKLCETRSVTLTEEMAESMTCDVGKLPLEERQAALRKVAHIAKDQGSWSLACKKYTQAGDRVKAMKMLMRGGETEKVIFFANHSRNAEIYTMAANFLQSQNWSADANIYKSIVLFYTKAKAHANLFVFYESCSQLQIDEHRNYPEALRALEDCIAMAASLPANKVNIDAEKVEQLKRRVEVLRGFVKAQRTVDSMVAAERGSPAEKTKADGVIATCSDLIKRSRPANPDHYLIQDALRIGDVFALMVRFYFDKMGESNNALKVMESMSKHGADPQLFIEMDYMEKVCQANGKSLANVLPSVAADGTPSAGQVAGRKVSTDTRRSSVVDELDRNT